MKSDEARRYQRDVQRAHKDATGLAKLLFGHAGMTGPVAVTVAFYRPAKRGDLDNRLKVLLDALKGIAFVDDKQVVEIHATQHDDKANPRAVVTVEAA